MIDFGVNPFVVIDSGYTQFDINNLSHLHNLPTQKSIFFPTQSFACCNKDCKFDLSEPWLYKNGTFPGQFEEILGQGASSIVLRGTFQHKKAAFKFVEIKNQSNSKKYVMDSLKELNKQLNDMTSIQSVSGNKVVQLYGHFRLDFSRKLHTTFI